MPSDSRTTAGANAILAHLSTETLDRLQVRTEDCDLQRVFFEAGDTPADIYFPHAGSAASVVRPTEDGSMVEVGVTGFEGFFNVQCILSPGPVNTRAIVQARGPFSVIDAAKLREECTRVAPLQRHLLAYVGKFVDQLSQNAVCNRLHKLEQRLAKWLLLMRDRVGGDDVKMTHEFISTMLGVRRSGVTIAIGALEMSGLVEHKRNQVSIRDAEGLERTSCECYAVLHEAFLELTMAQGVRMSIPD